MTEGIFAVLCVSIMGLTRFYKTTVFTFIFAVFLLNVKDIYTVSQKRGATLTIAITLSFLDGFGKFFHCCKEQ